MILNDTQMLIFLLLLATVAIVIVFTHTYIIDKILNYIDKRSVRGMIFVKPWRSYNIKSIKFEVGPLDLVSSVNDNRLGVADIVEYKYIKDRSEHNSYYIYARLKIRDLRPECANKQFSIVHANVVADLPYDIASHHYIDKFRIRFYPDRFNTKIARLPPVDF